MKGSSSSRTHHSLSSLSSRSYVSDHSRSKSCSSRESLSSNSSSKRSNSRKMKFIIIMGIALPILAAIIGVVAWALSADSAFHSPVASSLRRLDTKLESHEEDIFQALENRRDIDFTQRTSFNQENASPDYSRIDNIQPQEDRAFDDTAPEKDPLYIVHFVPSPKPKVESSTAMPDFGSTVSNDVLKKILSASKGTKSGIPQFVVFAPVPGEEELQDQPKKTNVENDFLSNPLANLRFQSIKENRKTGSIDYDYEEEVRKYEELLKSRSSSPTGEEITQSQENSKSQNQIKKQSLVKATPSASAISSGDYINQNTPNLYTNQQNPLAYAEQQNTLNKVQQPSLRSQTRNIIQSNPALQNTQQPTRNYPLSYFQTQQQAANGYQQQNQKAYLNYPQGYLPQQSAPAYSQSNVHGVHHSQASERSGQYEPVGIKLNIGGGAPGILGGGYSPLGIIASILAPLLPRPSVDLNGKLMFGVMLEKGLKFDGQKRASHG